MNRYRFQKRRPRWKDVLFVVVPSRLREKLQRFKRLCAIWRGLI